jgi:gluconate 2-dehydrogenase gamma chain
MMDRRELLTRASMLLGGVITASAASGILAGCAIGPEASAEGPVKSGFLTAAETATVTAMADQIIPRTDTVGAVDVGVPAFIDRMVSGYYTDKERGVIRAGLAAANADATRLRAKPFAALTSDEQVALMKQYDQEQYAHTRANSGAQGYTPHFFRLIKELTIIGFCMSEQGATKLMYYNQNPGPYRGDVPLAQVGKVSAL